MRALGPVIADLARAELATWRGRVVTLERMRRLTLEIILRVVLGARGREAARAARRGRRDARPRALDAADARDGPRPARPRAAQPVGPVPAGRGALRRAAARRRSPAAAPIRATTRCSSFLLEQRDEDGRPPDDRHLRDQLVALLVGGHDSSASALAWAFERLARHPAVQARLRDGDPAYLDAVVKEVLRVRPSLTIAPRRLLAPVEIAGRRAARGRSGRRVHLAGASAARTCGRRRARSGPSAGSGRRRSRTRCRGSRSAAACAAAPARRSPRWRCARSCARPPICSCGPSAPSPSARGAACSSSSPHRGGEVLVERA